MEDDDILELMFANGKKPKGQILLNHLTPPAKLINRIIVHTLLPKMSSFHYLNPKHAKLVYSIFFGIEFNWAKILCTQFGMDHTLCIPYGVLITRILNHYNVVLSNEIDETWCKEQIDSTTLKRMKMDESRPSTPSASSSRQPKLQDQILETLQILGSKINNLITKLTLVENNVDEIYEKS